MLHITIFSFLLSQYPPTPGPPPLPPSFIQKSEEPFGMNVAGGAGGTVGDLPIFISAIKQDSIVGRSRKIQVSGQQKLYEFQW